ncbi:MAG TPA: protein kinase [Isosphaeraceae bacterium]|jgi:serine/threonine protein kinase/tetratricopeptide (TPR) repeat protein|nr:protein kinase [Isosphaeraceae bacterium]
MNLCSSDRLLSPLLEEQLDADEHASIVAHVETCPSCQERLEELTSDSSLLIDRERFDGFASDPSSTDPWLSLGSGASTPQSARRFIPDSASRTTEAQPGGPSGDAEVADLAGYDILAELGHGGMGVVYKARHRRLNRLVALKMIRAGSLARAEDITRFKIEAETVASLRHPNIIQIYDVGESGGLPFVALELLEGGSLDTRLAGTPQPGRQAAAMIALLARAVHTAHQAAIIHRDLKPSNVLFTLEGTAKITDFGLAKRLEQDGHTESGQVMGSPSYIPPEQAQGRTKDVGPTADVYALGAILYEMLTGRPPFKGTTPVETVMQVLHEEPVPPSRLQSKVPRDLETICLKCLAKEPHKRFVDAEELADDLERYLADQPIRARRTPLWERGLKWARRRPTAFTFLALGLVVAVILGAAGLRHRAHLVARARSEDERIALLRRQTEIALTKARDDLLNGREDTIEKSLGLLYTLKPEPRLADLRSRVNDLLEEARRRRVEHESQAAGRQLFDEFRRRRDDALFHDTQLTGLHLSGNLEAVRKSARAALEFFEDKDHRGDDWTLATLPSSLTEAERGEVVEGCYEMLMVLAEAVALPLPGESSPRQALEALRILDRAAALPYPPTHAYHLRRAECLVKAGDTEEAERERSVADSLKPDGAFDHFLSGLERYKHNDLAQAKQHFDAALRIQPNHFWAQCLLAICDLNSQPPHPEEANAHLLACLQTHQDLAWLYLLRGFAYGQMGTAAATRAEAEASFRAAEMDYNEAIQRDSAGELRYALLTNRGLVRFQSRKLGDAIADLREAIDLNPRQHNAYVTLAQVYRQQHDLDAAVEQLGRAIDLQPDLAQLYRTRARWNLERPDLTPTVRAAALKDLGEAISRGKPGSRELVKDHAERGRVLLLCQRYAEALNDCDAALKLDPENTEAHRWRVAALLELKRYDEVIASCDGYLRKGRPSAELLELRGLARAKRNDFASAIEDYTRALVLQPDQSSLHGRRGWAYLVSGAPQLAQRDFEEAIRLDPSSGDAYSGRGSALVLLGLHREAINDAEESLRRGEPSPRMLYNASRIFAQAAASLAAQAGRRGRAAIDSVRHYQERALELLALALEHTPHDQRTAFWNEVVVSDQALAAIRGLPAFSRLAAKYAPSSP